MIRESHSGGAEGETHLVFSSRTPDGADSIFGEMTGQDAHDHWALPRRVKEILECRRALHLGSPPFECLVRKEKHLLLYLLLAAAPRSQRFLELGSSIFEVIDGLNLAGKILSWWQ